MLRTLWTEREILKRRMVVYNSLSMEQKGLLRVCIFTEFGRMRGLDVSPLDRISSYYHNLLACQTCDQC